MEFVSPTYSSENKGHYSPGVLSNGMLYVSGQLSIDPDTHEVPKGGIEEHARVALANVDRVLVEAGLCRTDVVHCRVYVTDVRDWEAFNRVYGEFFGTHKPARVVVPVPALHYGCLVEIEAIAETASP